MKQRGGTQRVNPGASQPQIRAAKTVSLSPGEATDGVLRQRQLQQVARRVFEELPVAPLANALGVEIQIALAPVLPVEWTADDLLRACRSRSKACLNENGAVPKNAVCEECVCRELEATLRSGPTGWEFTCRLGGRQLWVAVRAADLTLGILLCSWPVPVGAEVGRERREATLSQREDRLPPSSDQPTRPAAASRKWSGGSWRRSAANT